MPPSTPTAQPTSGAPPFRQLPQAARLLVALVGVAAMLAVVLTPDAGLAAHGGLAALVVMAVLALGFGAIEVAGPGPVAFQPALGLLLAAALLLPPWTLGVLAVLCFAPAALARGQRWYLAAYNVGVHVVAGCAASAVAHAVGGPLDATARDLVGVAGAVAALVAVDHLLVALAVTASGARSRAVPSDLRDALLLDLSLATTGGAAAVLWTVEPVLVLLIAGPLAVAHRALAVPGLRHEARLDPKTALYHLTHFRPACEDALAEAARTGRPLSLVMVDLDHLRAVNNRFGHLAGDDLIDAVARILREAAGRDGIAARFGGEEFSLLLPGLSAREARAVGERVREALTACRWEWSDELTATLSVGVATYPEHGTTVESLLSAADSALYDAKLGGRNRVRVAVPESARASLVLGNGPVPPPAPASVLMEPGWAPVDEQPALGPVADEPAVRRRPRAVVALAAAVLAGALGVALLSDPEPVVERPLLFGLLLALFALLDHVRIDLFERAHISPASVPVLLLAVEFGPLGPIAAEAMLTIARVARRVPVVGWSFDFGSLALAGAAAAGVYDVIGPDGSLEVLAASVAAALAYYAVNIPLLSAVMALSEGARVRTVFVERLAWLWPQYAAFGVTCGGMVLVERQLGAPALAFLVFPLAILWISERQYVDRSRESVAELRRRSEELQEANRRLHHLLAVNQELLSSMQRSSVSTIASLARTIEAKDPYTGGHTERVRELAAALAAEVGLAGADLRAVEVGAVIHDIGKIGVPDHVLTKEGPLDDAERAAMRRHPEISSYILSELELPAIVKQMVRSHHERFDGTGYPDRLAGEEIPLSARVLAVADTLDAMTSDRSYRTARRLSEAVEEIRAQAGRQFCPRVVAALDRLLERDATIGGQFDGDVRTAPAAA